jgi:hypothetical protein
VPHTPQIVEGVMSRVLHDISTLVWNCLQQGWGPDWDATFVPLECGNVAVKISEQCAGDWLMEVGAFGFSVSTWLDSKRPFYRAHLPEEWGDYQFIDWAKLVFEELECLSRVWYATRTESPTVPIVRIAPLPRGRGNRGDGANRSKHRSIFRKFLTPNDT